MEIKSKKRKGVVNMRRLRIRQIGRRENVKLYLYSQPTWELRDK